MKLFMASLNSNSKNVTQNIMSDNKYNFNIPTSSNVQLNIPLKEGKALFVLGANGTGKSTLMYNLFQQNFNHAKRILAHRQMWFLSNSMTVTSSQKKTTEQHMKTRDNQIDSRWKDDYSSTRPDISIFDLINSENIRAREITSYVDLKDISSAEKASNIQSPLKTINELLELSNIPIVISLGENDELFASKYNGTPYSVAELSDGERNVLLICSDVLTAKQNQLIIIDEPERHLHRSIISPLLSALFQKRKDCVFVISTHDIYLPIDHKESSVLLLRDCTWNGKSIQNWNADLISDTDEIPNKIKRDILGSKKNILFVEGDNTSLDIQIYQIIYPQITVIAAGSCTQVEKAVTGIRESQNLHWINAIGLIDADDRSDEQIESLNEKGIAALNCYSVESLYYNLEIIKKISEIIADSSGEDQDIIFQTAISNIEKNIKVQKASLCSKLCEKKIRNKIMSQLPNHKDILNNKNFYFEENLDLFFKKETDFFDKLIQNNELNALISRYPVRESNVLTGIANGLGIDRNRYENMVRKLIIDDSATNKFFRENLLLKLTDLIITKKD
jgi:ABC-type cobalamin/Fe3+-siderophores transport system ATPase subunit